MNSPKDDRNLGSAGDRGGEAAGPLRTEQQKKEAARYADLLSLPCPTSKKHPRMDRLTRAAQFSPFAALTGFGDVLEETGRLTEDYKTLTEEAAEAVGRQLHALREAFLTDHTPKSLTLTHFLPDPKKTGGSYRTETVTVKRVEDLTGALLLTDGRRILPEHILSFDS